MTNVEMRESYKKIRGIIAEINELNGEMAKGVLDVTTLCISSNLTHATHILNQAINQLFHDGYEP